MDALLKIALYAAAGLLLLAVNLWFVRNLYSSFAGVGSADRIAPFQIVGKDDAAGKLANAMPVMLHAHLRRITREMNDALAALAPSARAESSASAQLTIPGIGVRGVSFFGMGIDIADRRAFDDPRTQILVPSQDLKVFRAPDIAMSVGGVEVGGLISWAHRALVQDRLLEVSVFYRGDTASVYGSVGGQADFNVYLKPEDFAEPPSDDDIAAMIAYSIMQQEYRRSLPVFGAFTARGFRDLVTAVSRVAELNRQVVLGRTPSAADYKVLLPDLLRLVEIARGWQPLVRLAAGVAENADDLEAATRLYRAELALVGDRDAVRRRDLEAKLAQLSERASAAEFAARAPAAVVPDAELVERIHELLGVESLQMRSSPTIAVLGGLPSKGLLAEDAMTVLGGPPEPDPSNAAYFDSLVRAVQLVAPKARYLFRAGTVWTAAGLVDAIGDLADAEPAVLLVTLGPLTGPVYEEAFKALADGGTLVVIAAGNQVGQPVPLDGSPLLDRVMVVAAVSLEGRPSAFTQRGEKVSWAPGEDIPVYVAPGATRPEPQKGTTYSAALAAGIAARVLAEHPAVAPARLVETLRASARPASGQTEPAILNLDSALEYLTENPGQG
jgi:Subtilase family